MEIVRKGCRVRLGNGNDIRFWSDIWVVEDFLDKLFLRFYFILMEKEVKVLSMGFWDGMDQKWCFRWRRVLFDWEKEMKDDMMKKL